MNNPLRKWLLRHLEFAIFRQLLSQVDLKGKLLLDLACGSGYSSYLIEQYYQPRHVVAFDIMERQINLASQVPTSKTLRFIGDITQLGLKDKLFDAAFGFGILHHIKGWQQALAEISRVIKPGGYLIIEEPNGLSAAFFRKFLGFQIPKEGHFRFVALEQEFHAAGFEVLATHSVLLPCFQAYLLRKLEAASP